LLIISLLVALALLSACATATTATPTTFIETTSTSTPTSIPPTATIEPSPTIDPNMPAGAAGKDAEGYYMDAGSVRYRAETVQIGNETTTFWMTTQMKNGPIMLVDGQITLEGAPSSVPIDIRSKKDLAISQQLGLLSHTTTMADYPTQDSRIASTPETILYTLYTLFTPPGERSPDKARAFLSQLRTSPQSVILHFQIPNNATDAQSAYTTIDWNPVVDGYREDLVDWNDLNPTKDPSIQEFAFPFPMRIKFIKDGNTLHALVATSLTTFTEQQKDVLTFAPFYMGLLINKMSVINSNPQKNELSNIPTSSGSMDAVAASSLISSQKSVVPYISFGN